MANKRFSPSKDIPKYSLTLISTLRTPVVMYFVLLGQFILFTCISVFHQYEVNVNPGVTSWTDSFWWGIVTMTTVGYGDIVPVTTEGRVTALFLIILGVGLFVSFTALFVSVLFRITSEEIEETKRASQEDAFAILNQLKVVTEKLEKLENKLR